MSVAPAQKPAQNLAQDPGGTKTPDLYADPGGAPPPDNAVPPADPAVMSTSEPAADIARRVASELQQLSHVTARIECAVSGLILNNTSTHMGASSGLHNDLQSLDSLGQMLEALAQFLGDIASQIPQDWQFDPTKAAASLKLKDLANRLSNQDQTNTPDSECDFF